MGRKRILLVNPKTVNKYYQVSQTPVDKVMGWFFKWFYDRNFDIPTHSHCTTMPPVSLYALEGLMTDRFDIVVVDEQVDEIDFEMNVDLVCVTSTTTQIRRAYEISLAFRNRGIPTLVGGVHATGLPDECQRYFSTVCVGEAEGYIEELLNDFMIGKPKERYENTREISLEEVPFYRYEIGGGKYLPFHVINYSRGCPFKCEFCSIQSTLGRFRTRPVRQVVEEIKRVGSKSVWFPDATLTADLNRAKELFEALVPLKIQWLGQITLNMARDERLLDIMADSGCWIVSIGFESLSKESIRSAAKFQNRVEGYDSVIRSLHERNIGIEGNFVFGFDSDHTGVFEETAKFVVDTGIDLPEFYVLTPYPDTELFAKFESEGRIVDMNWSHYDNTHFHHLPVFQPKNMSREELRAGCHLAEREAYSTKNTLRRLARSGVRRLPIWMANYIYSRRSISRHNLIPSTEEIEDRPIPEPGKGTGEIIEVPGLN